MSKRKKRGKKQFYPWEQWMSYTRTRTLVKGKDYFCKTTSMLVMLREKAVQLNKVIRTSKTWRNDSNNQRLEAIQYQLLEKET